MNEKVTVGALQQMKRDGRKIVGVVAWDYQIATIADQTGVEIVSVGDSVGVNLWGHRSPLEVTLAEMLIVCRAVRRGVSRALVSVDIPFGPVQEGHRQQAVRAAITSRQGSRRRGPREASTARLTFPGAVAAVTRASRFRCGRSSGSPRRRRCGTVSATRRCSRRARGCQKA